MDNERRPRTAEEVRSEGGESIEKLPGAEEGSRESWGLSGMIEGEAEEIGDEPTVQRQQPASSERELWRTLAAQRGARASSSWLASAQFVSADRGKLHERVRQLIDRLSRESLEEFSGLVAFTETFLARAEFVCDLVVYLFAEREKGLPRDGTESRRYIGFFTEKLMWELEVANRLAEQRPLSRLNEEYEGWLMDRILDGEVLL